MGAGRWCVAGSRGDDTYSDSVRRCFAFRGPGLVTSIQLAEKGVVSLREAERIDLVVIIPLHVGGGRVPVDWRCSRDAATPNGVIA